MSPSSALPSSHQIYVFLYTSAMWPVSPSVVVCWLYGQSGMYNCWFSRPCFVQRLFAPGYWGQVMKQLAVKPYRIIGPILVSLTPNFFQITAPSLVLRACEILWAPFPLKVESFSSTVSGSLQSKSLWTSKPNTLGSCPPHTGRLGWGGGCPAYSPAPCEGPSPCH